MMTRNDKLVVFDWNGTLLDDALATHQAVNAVLRHVGAPPVDLDRLRDVSDFPVQNLYRSLGIRQNILDQNFEELVHVFHDHYEPLALETSLRSGAENLLRQLTQQGVNLIVLSNHLCAKISEQTDRLGIRPFISEILANECRRDHVDHKPKGERLSAFMTTHGLQRRNAIIVGDTPEEAEIGHLQGLTSVLITGGIASESRLRAANPHYLIDQLPALHDIILERMEAVA